MLAHQLAPELELVLADRLRQLVHEALDEDGVLVDVHAAPEARRDVRVAHGVVDQQVRDGVAERVLAVAGQRPWKVSGSLPVVEVLREHVGQDRLARQPHVQAGQVVVGIEAADQLALHDRVIAARASCPPRATTTASPACRASAWRSGRPGWCSRGRRRAGRTRRRGGACRPRTCRPAGPTPPGSRANAASPFCVGPHTSHLSGV